MISAISGKASCRSAVSEVEIAGQRLVCDPWAVLYIPAYRLLAVADLHLEKGASMARRGTLAPPYDSAVTLNRLERVLETYQPSTVVCAGDSFHDGDASSGLPLEYRRHLCRLMTGREWIWIAGNHDPEAPLDLPGESVAELTLGSLILRHKPGVHAVAGEIAGHLHPGARIVRHGRSVRRACFALDRQRLILPAFGAFTGCLNVLDNAFRDLFCWQSFRAYMIGPDRLYPMSMRALVPD